MATNYHRCEICRRNGILRVDCSLDSFMNELMGFLSRNIVNNSDYIYGIEQILSNIRDHTNMTNESLMALLSIAVLDNRAILELAPTPEPNENNTIKMEININVINKIQLVNENKKTLEYCAICLENVDIFGMATFNCEHSFCAECVIKTICHSKKSISKPMSMWAQTTKVF